MSLLEKCMAQHQTVLLMKMPSSEIRTISKQSHLPKNLNKIIYISNNYTIRYE